MRKPISRYRVVAIGVALAGMLAAAPNAASGAWSASGSGRVGAAAATMPTGSVPVGSPGVGSVSLSWAAAALSNGTPVAGYLIHRYDATNGQLQAVGGGCSGIVTTTTCTDQPVPVGSWIYTDTPVLNSWTGGQSPASSPVVVTS